MGCKTNKTRLSIHIACDLSTKIKITTVAEVRKANKQPKHIQQTKVSMISLYLTLVIGNMHRSCLTAMPPMPT